MLLIAVKSWVCLLFGIVFCTVRCDIQVSLDCGNVKGSNVSTDLGEVFEFHQIPYGVPPIGPLRWTHSQLLGAGGAKCWDGEYDASQQRTPPIRCVQYWSGEVNGQEDCLYLSVRSPDVSASLPVLVWIHGGSLMNGWSDDPGYSPDASFTSDLNVVTVNINYRLDLMGFFSTPEIWNDPENPGNYGNFGIGDAVTALRWVQANIVHFGGDPSSVTVMGESSGGTVALGLLVADQADGLFNKAIIMSAPTKWESTYQDAYEARKSFVSDVGCDLGTEAERRECLKSKDVASIIQHVDLGRGWGFYDFPLGDGWKGESMDYNVLEPTLVKVSPQDLGKEENTANKRTSVTVLLVSTAQETGYNPLYYSTNQVITWNDARDLLSRKIKNLQNDTGFRVGQRLRNKIDRIYRFGDDTEWWPQIFFDTLTTDLRATCLTNQMTEELNNNPLYTALRVYVKSRPDEVITAGSVKLPFETVHGWDTEALFGFGWFQLSSSKERHQRKLENNIRDMVEYVCHDKEVVGHTRRTSLILENKDFPKAVRIQKMRPQSKECAFWRKNKMLQWGWQN